MSEKACIDVAGTAITRGGRVVCTLRGSGPRGPWEPA